jgi:hypothetical protein
VLDVLDGLWKAEDPVSLAACFADLKSLDERCSCKLKFDLTSSWVCSAMSIDESASPRLEASGKSSQYIYGKGSTSDSDLATDG